jgi:hypothetical protein
MANNTGLQITPLSMAVAGALWLVLFSLMAWNLAKTVELAQAMSNLPAQVQDHENRIRALESRR